MSVEANTACHVRAELAKLIAFHITGKLYNFFKWGHRAGYIYHCV